MKQAKIRQWGNSLAIRIPAVFIRELGLKEGNTVVLDRTHKNIVIKRASRNTGAHAKNWREFLIPTHQRKKQAVSKNIDRILYGSPR